MSYSDSWESPCRRICRLNYKDVCTGCGRTSYEIGRWPSCLEHDKIEMNRLAKQRLHELKEETKK